MTGENDLFNHAALSQGLIGKLSNEAVFEARLAGGHKLQSVYHFSVYMLLI